MKAILCGLCSDIRALSSSDPVTCRCGNVTGWWVDATKGIAKIKAQDHSAARFIGFHNWFLKFAFSEDTDKSNDGWRKFQEFLQGDDASKGFIFHKDKRACPVAIMKIGETSDVTWDDEGP